jgi:hypothetical protein
MSRDVDPSVKHLLGVAAKYDGAAAVILVVGEFRIVVRRVPRSRFGLALLRTRTH